MQLLSRGACPGQEKQRATETVPPANPSLPGPQAPSWPMGLITPEQRLKEDNGLLGSPRAGTAGSSEAPTLLGALSKLENIPGLTFLPHLMKTLGATRLSELVSEVKGSPLAMGTPQPRESQA